jgi:hypothetical protein
MVRFRPRPPNKNRQCESADGFFFFVLSQKAHPKKKPLQEAAF